MRMRILHVVGALNRGGAESWLVQVLQRMDRAKYQFDFLVHSTEPGAYDEDVKTLGARVIPCVRPSNPLQYATNFHRTLRQFGPYDCVHSHVHTYSGYILMLAAMMRVPVRIAHSHNDTRTIDRGSPFFRAAYVSAMKSLILRFATAGMAVSESAAYSLFSESWALDPRWSMCPLGINLGPFHQEVDPQLVRSQFGIPPDAFVVGHVGRFVEQKNHCFLVDVAESFCRLEPKAVFLLVGDGPLKLRIQTLVRRRGLASHFIFTGVRSDVPRIMKGAMDCFLFPSLYEGVGLVLWEAQAAGLPCLVSGSIPPEADVGSEGVARLSLQVSPNEWAAQLRKASQSSNSRSNNNSRSISKDWQRSHSIEASAERLFQLYQLLEN